MDKKSVAWTDQAKADLRAIDQPTALRILHAIARYLASGEGDVKRLQDIKPPELRRFHSRPGRPASPPGRSAARLARRRKGWCLASNPSLDAPHKPATAPALRAQPLRPK